MPDFPYDDSEMGKAIRRFDWASTSTGPIETWPVSLKTTVQMILKQGHAICLFWGPDLNIIYNDAYRPLLGLKEQDALGKPFHILWSDVWDDVKPFVDEALSGRGTFAEDLHLVMDRNAYPEDTYWTFSYSPLYDDHGKVAGLINITVETTPTVESRKREEVLRRELVHRVKNTMAITTAVVSATLRHSPTLEEARDTIKRRIAALGNAQNLMHASGKGASISALVRDSVYPHLDDKARVIISGPDMEIAPQQALGLSLAVYELATNALKYGALSNESGRVEIVWTLDDSDRFELRWRETGGPTVRPPTRKGFGSRLTNQIVAAYFSGEGRTFYHPDGLVFELDGKYEAEDGETSGS
ncbi:MULTISPECIES: sensor histidine kinase [unclassified Rhizobium]|uniref:sensor histidine kinase n=1 Tax=unclassified Rhizobium TaxID=2613769 RepID=UPI002478CEBA|nr:MULTISPECIES: HWE histidine kinase domain-containing protein [unclassified Rhizobium]MDH7800240.1 two-component sensor histidine kinase [Rhizobium sp. AN70]